MGGQDLSAGPWRWLRCHGPLPARAGERAMTSVSVVIPCYKYGHFLEEAVTSVLDDQEGVDVRVLIIDDASPDDSADVARKIAARQGLAGRPPPRRIRLWTSAVVLARQASAVGSHQTAGLVGVAWPVVARAPVPSGGEQHYDAGGRGAHIAAEAGGRV